MKKLGLLFCSVVFSSSALALSLDEALKNAYETSEIIKGSQEEYKSNIQSLPEALSNGFLPDISIRTSLSDQKKPGIVQSNPFNPQGNITNKRSEIFSKSFVITQNIFSGGSASFGLAAARHFADISLYQYINKEQEFISKSIETYINYLVAKEQLESSRLFVQSSTKEYEATHEKLTVGEATRTDVAKTKSQMFQAKSEFAKNLAQLKVSENSFKSSFGTDPSNVDFPALPQDLPSTYEEFKNDALAKSLHLKIAKANLSASQNKTYATSGRLLPQVNASASKDIQIVKPKELSRAVDSNIKSKTHSYTTSLTIDFPILSKGGAEHSRIRKEKALHRKAAYDLENTKKNIETQLISVWETYISSLDTVNFATERVEASKLAYEGTKTSYEVGLQTIVDLLKAEKDLYDSLLNKIVAKQQMIMAAFKIKSELAQLTAKNMKISDKPFDPESELRKTKFKVIGF